MSEHKQPEYEKEETMKKNQIRKSVAALAMAAVVGVSLLGYGCGSKPASPAGGVSGDFIGTAKGMGGDVTVTLTLEDGKKYFSVASGGGTGRTLHPDNVAAGPASYGLTDSLGRVHGDAQFAGSSSVPAHVEMMGLIGMGNNPMVGATVACAVAAAQANA